MSHNSNASGSGSGSGDDGGYQVVASTTKRRHNKGAVTMSRVIMKHKAEGTKLTVHFDSKNRPVGDNGTVWRSVLGKVARQSIPITFDDWRKVPAHYKTTLWNEAIEIFEGCDPHMKSELKVACSMWKTFKTRLATEYIFGEKGEEELFRKYQFLDRETWMNFRQARLSDHFLAIRQSNQELRTKNVYPHTIGRGGYAKLEESLRAATVGDSVEEETASNVVIPERHEMWKLGRKKGDKYVNEASARVATKIDELVVRSSQGQWSSQERHHDILTEAIGTPEPRGRTRGVGALIPWGLGLGKSSTSSKRTKSSTTPPPATEGFSRHCPAVSDPLDNIPKDGLKCLLYIYGLNDAEKQPVAIGRAVTGRVLNYRAISEGDVVVKVDQILETGYGATLPSLHPNFSTVQAAVHNHVPWPRDLIVVDARGYDQYVYAHLQSTEFVDNMFVDSRLLQAAWNTLGKNMITVEVDGELFGEYYSIMLTDDDVAELLKFDAMGNSVFEFYISHLHDQLRRTDDVKFGFLSPSIMSPAISIDHRVATLVGRLSMPDYDRVFCYFLPYVDHVMFHWMLCVIFPKDNTVLWLDSSSSEGKDINPDVKNLVDTGLRRYYRTLVPRVTRKVQWKIVKCPRQPPSLFCGYYVLQYIQDIIQYARANDGAQVDDIYRHCFPEGNRSYGQDKIFNLREDICRIIREYLSENFRIL